MELPAIRALVKYQLLMHAPEEMRPWTLQGLGMLRLYLDVAQTLRLHVWDPEHAVPNVSPIHNHPWDFESLVLCGRLVNKLYVPADGRWLNPAEAYQHVRIRCGEGGGALGGSETGYLAETWDSGVVYGPGERYRQRADELHQTVAEPGTVTIVRREFTQADCDHADVWWKEGPWVSAEPRPATVDEVAAITRKALRWLDAD